MFALGTFQDSEGSCVLKGNELGPRVYRSQKRVSTWSDEWLDTQC